MLKKGPDIGPMLSSYSQGIAGIQKTFFFNNYGIQKPVFIPNSTNSPLVSCAPVHTLGLTHVRTEIHFTVS